MVDLISREFSARDQVLRDQVDARAVEADQRADVIAQIPLVPVGIGGVEGRRGCSRRRPRSRLEKRFSKEFPLQSAQPCSPSHRERAAIIDPGGRRIGLQANAIDADAEKARDEGVARLVHGGGAVLRSRPVRGSEAA